MTAALNPNLAGALAPPVMEARRWIAEAEFPPNRPLLNFSQAAPVDPPPEALREAMATAVLERPEVHLYGPVLGDPELRQAIAARTAEVYGASIDPSETAVTSGCNQAFCAAVASLAAPGDAVMLPVPWYFNHKMWLDMSGIEARPLPCDDAMLPDIEAARAAMDDRVRAILLITPNNPTGAEYPPALMQAFLELAEAQGAALIVDETYRDFHSREGAPHPLFRADGWADTLIHLYSFSKVYRLTGHRIGAIVTGRERLAQIEKFLDTVTICPSRLGQAAALEGLATLGPWVAGERTEILARRKLLLELFAERLPDWRVLGAGAYFAWIEPPSTPRPTGWPGGWSTSSRCSSCPAPCLHRPPPRAVIGAPSASSDLLSPMPMRRGSTRSPSGWRRSGRNGGQRPCGERPSRITLPRNRGSDPEDACSTLSAAPSGRGPPRC